MTTEFMNELAMLVLANIEAKLEKSTCSGINEKRENICVLLRDELLRVQRIGINELPLLMMSTA